MNHRANLGPQTLDGCLHDTTIIHHTKLASYYVHYLSTNKKFSSLLTFEKNHKIMTYVQLVVFTKYICHPSTQCKSLEIVMCAIIAYQKLVAFVMSSIHMWWNSLGFYPLCRWPNVTFYILLASWAQWSDFLVYCLYSKYMWNLLSNKNTW